MPQEFQIHPDTTLMVDRSRIVGGKITTREIIRDHANGEGRTTETKVLVQIADEAERAKAENIRSRAYTAIRQRTTYTIIGHLAPRDRVSEIMRVLSEISEEASAFNAIARTCQVEIGLLPIDIAVSLGPEAVRAIADHVRTELEAMRNQLRAGDAKGAQNTLIRTRNLQDLAVGVQADSIRFAVEEAGDRLSELKKRIKASESTESAGRSLDLAMIESGIDLFTYRPMSQANGHATGV